MRKSSLPAGPVLSGRGWSELWKKEDWWAIWLGLGIIITSIIFWVAGSSLDPIALIIPEWSEFTTVVAHFNEKSGLYFLQFLAWLAAFGIAVHILGYRIREFIPGFALLFILALLVLTFGSWEWAKKYNLEAPLVALALGMLIGNTMTIPKWLDATLRTEFYVKTGIVLLGATLPFTKIIQAGPMAFFQATLVAAVTFLSIYLAGTKLFGLDKRFAATLGAGGSICGVSASIAMGSSVKAEKNHVSVSISLVIVWAIVMIYMLPIIIKYYEIHPGPAGAWIGTSEFADAAGMAAAAAIGEQSIRTFTLMKVVGRDMFIGIWCFIMALISVTRWEKRESGTRPDVMEIWYRFPKFVMGFFVASALITFLVISVDVETAATINSQVINPIKTLRTWAFTFCFLCIGLTTRFRELSAVGWRPFAAFTTGVLINVPFGYVLSNVLFAAYWMAVH
jgi:uncharacterized integral membrane protein (TIGR00698 family)